MHPKLFEEKSGNIVLFASLGFLILVLWWMANKNEIATSPGSADQQLPEQISFNYHVKPILSDKCYACHGPDANKRKAGLRFDMEEVAKAELPENPGKFAIVPGDVAKSQLITRIFSEDAKEMMPPPDSHLSLTEGEKEILKRWIGQGARYERHWSFVPPKKASLPEVKNAAWPKNEIDYFVLAAMEKRGFSPAEKADDAKFLRRLSLDITGLPPTLEELQTYVLQTDSFALEQVIDHYLSKPAYGEQMTRAWLDVARYADSHGYQDDSYRTMWPWRDWVIHAFNENMPYDTFLIWQLAGDLLPHATKEQILATAFNRNHPITQEGGVIDEEYRSTYVSDRTNTFGKGILGLTIGCAKCHDHKYDPIAQKDYYSLYAFFNQVNEKGLRMDAVQAKNRKYYADAPYISISDSDLKGILSFVHKTDTVRLNVMVMNDSASRETHVLVRGNYDASGEKVNPATPKAILPFDDAYPRNRLGLSEWLTDRRNPLTARVYVNRLWAGLFGQGIVKTAEDFGSQGALPTHPELLDWLAVDFMEHGWNIKYLIKKIVSSATYRQSSVISEDGMKNDPENLYYTRGPRFRMQAEEIRDYVLATSGLMNNELGGPSVKPYQPPGLWEETNAGGNRGILTKYVPDTGKKLYRRSLYTFWKRTLPPPSMVIFDAPNRDLCEVRRQRTNTPLQALAMQNDEQVLEAARVLASSVTGQQEDAEAAIRQLFRAILVREPSEDELDIALRYRDDCLNKLQQTATPAKELMEIGDYQTQVKDTTETAALMMVAQVLYNLDETITKE